MTGARLHLLLLGLSLAGCRVSPLASAGRPCNAATPCGPGASCHPVSRICVTELDLAGPPDRIAAVEAADLSSPREQPRGPADAASDGRPPDSRVVDRSSDKPIPDKPPPDLKVPLAISPATLGTLLFSTKVPCVMSDGTVQPGLIPIADNPVVHFFDGAVALAGSPPTTKAWVGNQPSVIVVYDPNSCDIENVITPTTPEWTSGGLLIRGATLTGSGLQLRPGTTIQDLNVMNVDADGTYQGEYFDPDDSKLSGYPQLIQPLTKAKQAVLALAGL